MRIAAIGDVHCRVNTTDLVNQLLPDVEEKADVLVIAGDLTDTGLPKEAEVLCKQLKRLTIPVITVLGNHDHESNHPKEIHRILVETGVIVLDGSVHQIGEVGFVGTKGFCGGFGSNVVDPFGEQELKKFIRHGIDEVIRLERALDAVTCRYRIAVLHYAPIRETLHGEPEELFAFLGCSRLADALDRQRVDLVVHGHAHHGFPEGKTKAEIPVFNVSRFVQQQHNGQSYRLFELGEEKAGQAAQSA